MEHVTHIDSIVSVAVRGRGQPAGGWLDYAYLALVATKHRSTRVECGQERIDIHCVIQYRRMRKRSDG